MHHVLSMLKCLESTRILSSLILLYSVPFFVSPIPFITSLCLLPASRSFIPHIDKDESSSQGLSRPFNRDAFKLEGWERGSSQINTSFFFWIFWIFFYFFYFFLQNMQAFCKEYVKSKGHQNFESPREEGFIVNIRKVQDQNTPRPRAAQQLFRHTALMSLYLLLWLVSPFTMETYLITDGLCRSTKKMEYNTPYLKFIFLGKKNSRQNIINV